jgi:NDP-sugar pyrophosphorylase family protein
MLTAFSDRTFISFKGEFLPFLIQNQFSPEFSEYSFRFYANIQPNFKCIRVNSVTSFALANKSDGWVKDVFLDGTIPKSKCKIAKGCRLWGTTLGEQCVVEEKVKLTNVIALDGVVIQSGAVVEGCIISSQAVVGSNSVLKECLVGPKYQIPSEGRFTNEQLTVMEEAYFGD